MPYADPDPADPTVLVGVALPAGAGAMEEMAYVFAEEFCRMGWNAQRILRVFSDPFYAGAHRVYRALGEPLTREIIEECMAVWGQGRSAGSEGPAREGE